MVGFIRLETGDVDSRTARFPVDAVGRLQRAMHVRIAFKDRVCIRVGTGDMGVDG